MTRDWLHGGISLLRRYRWALGPLALPLAYAMWTPLFRLLLLSFITYFLLPWPSLLGSRFEANVALPRFEEISEAFGANELPLIGLSALVFLAAYRWLNPLRLRHPGALLERGALARSFLPGALHGTVLAAALVLAFVISGLYRYLGVALQFDELLLTLPGILIRIAAIATLVYCEEYFFRQRFLRRMRAEALEHSSQKALPLETELWLVAFTGVIYCVVKALQFELGLMHLLTLFLVSCALSLRARLEDGFLGGAGFWMAILIVFHPLFSLPVLGNDFPGIFLFKYQPAMEAASSSESARVLTGATGGPLAGIALQLLLAFDIARSLLAISGKLKKTLLHSPASG